MNQSDPMQRMRHAIKTSYRLTLLLSLLFVCVQCIALTIFKPSLFAVVLISLLLLSIAIAIIVSVTKMFKLYEQTDELRQQIKIEKKKGEMLRDLQKTS